MKRIVNYILFRPSKEFHWPVSLVLSCLSRPRNNLSLWWVCRKEDWPRSILYNLSKDYATKVLLTTLLRGSQWSRARIGWCWAIRRLWLSTRRTSEYDPFDFTIYSLYINQHGMKLMHKIMKVNGAQLFNFVSVFNYLPLEYYKLIDIVY